MRHILLLAFFAMLVLCGCVEEEKSSCGCGNSTANTNVLDELAQQQQAVAANTVSDTPADNWYTGKVEWQSIEGGFWLLIADDGHGFDPINLPKDFRKDGLRVRFQVKEKKGVSSFHMRGKIVEIISIEKL